MPDAHRNADARACGAATIVSGQSSVYVNGRLWAVQGDENTHGAGGLIPSGHTVKINGKKVIVNRADKADMDLLGHVGSVDETAGGSGSVSAY